MPVAPTYPGVYVEEIPSGVHPITGVATSMGAFIDFFKRGPLNAAVRIEGMSDFEREFGGLDTRSEASYALQQFFLNGGTEAWVVRVGAGGVAATLNIPATVAGSSFAATAGMTVANRSVTNPGRWGEGIRLEIDYDTSDPSTLFNLAVSEVVTQDGRLVVARTESFRNLSMSSTAATYAMSVVNSGSELIQLSSLGASIPKATGTIGSGLPVAPAIPPTGSTFNVNNKGCTIAYPTGGTPTNYPDLVPYIQAAIRAADVDDPLLAGAVVQLFGAGTSADKYRFRVVAGRGSNFTPTATLTFSSGVAPSLGLSGAGSSVNPQQYALTGATDPTAPITATDIRGARAAKTGLYALEDADLFNIMSIPAAAALTGTAFQNTIAEAEAYCEERRAFLIVDIPSSVRSPAQMQSWLALNNSVRNKNAAIYFPRPLIPDPLNDYRLKSVGASGTAAGLYARTDVARGVWKAPAGTEATLRNVPSIDYVMTDNENGTLNPIGVNCLRNFPIYGNICWGARTLVGSDQQASEWKYIPVRRLALFLEESLYRGTKWVVFEPNDEPLWAQIRLNVGAFMHLLFRQGAFQGLTPKEAYLVKCDKETTTQADIDLGRVNILVGFAPLKPAEFVILKIQQLAGQIET